MEYSIADQRLYIEGEPLSFFSGSFQYWRVRPELWAPILERVKGMGFSMIETYMPWSVHEIEPGEFDFGRRESHNDLARFLDTCHSAGVKVLARPGPHINAEMTYFGYPERLFADEALLARCADGSAPSLPAPPRMFPLPCYHHPRFLAEVRRYFEALASAIGGRDALYPGGPIVAIQADNECSKFMRANPFDCDYSEYAVKLYRKWLEARYKSLDEINKAYRSRHTSWSLIDPPRRMSAAVPADLPRVLDWTEFGEHYINESVRGIAAMLRDLFGDGVPMFHNYPVTLPVPPLDMTGAESFLDFQGVDSYPQRTAYHTLRAGVKYTSAMSRLPTMVEFSSGSVYYALPLTLDDQSFTTWAALMHGIKGMNFYMIVERERWYGAPVKSDGSLRERHYGFFKDLLSKVREWGLEDMAPDRQVLLLANREYERLANASTLMSPNSRLVQQFTGALEQPADLLVSDEEHGLTEPVGARYVRLFAFWYWALTAVGAHFALGDTGASAALLSGYKMVVVPTFEFMDSALQKKLLEYVEGGGTLVLGPRGPSMDERMEPCSVLARHMRASAETRTAEQIFGADVDEFSLFNGEEGEAGSLTYRTRVGGGSIIHVGLVPGAVCSVADAEPFAPMVDTILRAGGLEPAFVPSDARIDVALWRGGGESLLFVANPTDCAVTTVISHTGGARFADLRTRENYGGDGSFEIELEPYTIKALGTRL